MHDWSHGFHLCLYCNWVSHSSVAFRVVREMEICNAEKTTSMQARSQMTLQQQDVFGTSQVIAKFKPLHCAFLFYVTLKYRILTSELSPFLLVNRVGNFSFLSAFRKKKTSLVVPPSFHRVNWYYFNQLHLTVHWLT